MLALAPKGFEDAFRNACSTREFQFGDELQVSHQSSASFAEMIATCGDGRPNFAPPGKGLLKVSLVTGVDRTTKTFGDITGNVYSVGSWIAPDIAQSDLEALAKECLTRVFANRSAGIRAPDLEIIG